MFDIEERTASLPQDQAAFVDTAVDFSEVVLAILGVVAKLEWLRILDPTAHGYGTAKAREVKYGSKFGLTPHQRQQAVRREAEGEMIRAIAQNYNVSHSTISGLHGSLALWRG